MKSAVEKMRGCLDVLEIPHYEAGGVLVYSEDKVTPADQQKIDEFKSMFISITDQEKIVGAKIDEYKSIRLKSKL